MPKGQKPGKNTKPEPVGNKLVVEMHSEIHLRAVIDAAPNAMVMVDDGGRIVLVNVQAEKLFGYNREQMLGTQVDQLVPERFRGGHADFRHGFMASPDTRAMGAGRDLYGLRSDGAEVPIEIGLKPLHTDEGTFVLASIIDITERKKAEQNFRLMVEAAPNAMLMVDRDGRITLVNKQTETLFEYGREELIGQKIEMLVPESVRVRHPKLREAFFQSPEARTMGVGRDLYGLTKSGREVPIEIGLNPIETPQGLLTLASIIDITERKKIEERFRMMVEAAPNAMLMVNQQGLITQVNAQLEKLFGYNREELLNQPVEILVPASLRKKHPPMRNAFFASPESRAMGAGRELYGVTKAGVEVPIEIGLNPIETADGVITLASIIDISERKRVEERFRMMVEAAPNAMLMVNKAGIITQVNQQTERLFGYNRKELMGQPVEMLVPARVRDRHPAMREQFFSAPATRAMGAGRDLYGLTKTGEEIPVEIGLNPIDTPEGIITLASIIDISERKRAESLQRKEAANHLRQSILDSIPFSVIALDTGGRIIAVNPAAVNMLGYSREEMIGGYAPDLMHLDEEIRHHAALISKDMDKPVPADHNAIIARAREGLRDDSEWTYVRKDGVRIPIQLSVTPLKDDAGNITGYLKVAYDITERKRTEAYITHMAHHDPLTGLPNRVLLMDRIEMAIRIARREHKQVGVLLMDLDHFKRVNDTLGHHIGDQLLTTVSRRLQSRLRDSDTLARLGGDEFVVVLPDIDSREDIQRAVDQIVGHINIPIALDENEILITPSIGGSVFPNDGDDANVLLRNADTAMYEAKAAGRSNVKWFNEDMLRQNQEKLALISALKPALDGNQFNVHYQPEIQVSTGQVIGVEGLIRWQHPVHGHIAPGQFIPLAEETGMILSIGDWVLNTACREVARLNSELGHAVKLAVNVSPRQLQQTDWLARVAHALESSGLPSGLLELEITEGTLIQNPNESADLLRKLQESGISIVIDDFGTGYSSLSYLTRFPIDKIKIDRSFVSDLSYDVTDAAVIDAIIAMAHSLNIKVIAEGVENAEQMAYLRERGCDEAQGYYFSPAVPHDELPAAFMSVQKILQTR